MSTNEKTANEIIEELEAENERLRKLNSLLLAMQKTTSEVVLLMCEGKNKAAICKAEEAVKLMNELEKEAAICKAE